MQNMNINIYIYIEDIYNNIKYSQLNLKIICFTQIKKNKTPDTKIKNALEITLAPLLNFKSVELR